MPEDNKISSEQQLEILREKLMGNHAFAVCRGKLGSFISGKANKWITETDSPTSFLNKWDDFFGKVRVMTNLLAQFHRDGMKVAYDQLLRALESKTHFFPGETIPIEQTRPVTILMLEPKKTLIFLRWLLEEHWDTLRAFVIWKDGETGHNVLGRKVEKPGQLTEQLYEEFPTLETLARKHFYEYEGQELALSYKQTVTDTFRRSVLSKGRASELPYGEWNDHIEYVGHIPFVYVFEMEQSEVLKLFSRKDQSRITTWQFNVPKVLKHFYIGLHPEALHGPFEKSRPTFVSCGESCGFSGLVFVDNPLRSSSNDKEYPTPWHGQAEAGKYGIVFRTPD